MNYDELYILWKKAVRRQSWELAFKIGKELDLMRAKNKIKVE